VFDKSNHSGKFSISSGALFGELTIAKERTCLRLSSDKHFTLNESLDRTIQGVLHGFDCITLIDCISRDSGHRSSRGQPVTYAFTNVFPHFLVCGGQYLQPEANCISEVHFVVSDAATLFHDYDAFGTAINANKLIDSVVNSNEARIGRNITLGSNPIIAYFTGKQEIFSSETVIGKISAFHAPRYASGGPSGVRIDNTIVVSIKFRAAIAFRESYHKVCTLQNFFGLIVGRHQSILGMKLLLSNESDASFANALEVYSCMARSNTYDNADDAYKPDPTGILINGALNPQLFSSILAAWLAKEHDRKFSRNQFFTCFNKLIFDTDRLVAAANMFDILPASAVPREVQLDTKVVEAVKTSRRSFLELPPSLERDSMLNALGRIGKSSLKRKVRHRASILTNVVSERFPELKLVVDTAIDCRNYFVHGSILKFDLEATYELSPFLTETLEFVFATAELIEAGWEIRRWIEKYSTMSHPFCSYRATYEWNLQKLKVALAQPVLIAAPS
jgi:ApeA N-terminal domain 1